MRKEEIERRKALWEQSARGREVAAELALPPRPLKMEERNLLRWILEHGSEEAQTFLPQLEGIRAVRWCNCGCPSIRLIPHEHAPAGSPDEGHLLCDLLGATVNDEKVGIILFQRSGRLDLLEFYSLGAGLSEDSPEYGLPTIESLHFVEWESMPGFPDVRRPVKSPESAS